ncbi:MAG: RuBisCO large subunit C-terminal-like domain-containing protein [Chloroflexota bacterium]
MPFPQNTQLPGLSGERFHVQYRIYSGDVEAIAQGIALEQTVELPAALVPSGDVQAQIVGQIESIEAGEGSALVTISYAVETAGTGLPQLMNVVFGNTSMQSDIQVMRMDLPESITRQFRGPRYGISGLRELLHAPTRPLLATALKPVGLSAGQLAEIAYQFALGGIDIIKDDHGLANQPFCPFEERVRECADAVRRANAQTGRNALYMPNVTAPYDELRDRARFAKANGAGGVMVSWGLVGFDALRVLADDDDLPLPVLAHPALSGSFVASERNGMAHTVTYGQLMRLAGADAVIFVNYGGRFPYTEAQCKQVIIGCTEPMGHLRSIFPMPGGGMTLDRIPELHRFYGDDVVFLVAGGLYGYSDDFIENTRTFANLITR